jgi:hypothetical protein
MYYIFHNIIEFLVQNQIIPIYIGVAKIKAKESGNF